MSVVITGRLVFNQRQQVLAGCGTLRFLTGGAERLEDLIVQVRAVGHDDDPLPGSQGR